MITHNTLSGNARESLHPLQAEFAAERAIAPELMAIAEQGPFTEDLRQSAIHPDLIESATQWVYDPRTSEPVYQLLGRKFARNGYQVPWDFRSALAFMNADGTLFNAKIENPKRKSDRYLAKAGCGNQAFQPCIPASICKRVQERWGLDDPPPEGGAFWEWAEKCGLPILVVEGAKKGLAALSQGFIPIALFGATCGTISKDKSQSGQPEVAEALRPFLTRGRKVYWAMDCDRPGSRGARTVRGGMVAFHNAATLIGIELFRPTWSDQHKGLDDLVFALGPEALGTAIESARTMKEYLEDTKTGSTLVMKLERAHRLLEGRFRYNQMTGQVEIDGEAVSPDLNRFTLCELLNQDVSQIDADTIFLKLSQENQYDPVLEYLEEVHQKLGQTSNDLLNKAASRLLKSPTPQADFLLRKWMIAAVARRFEPACKVDGCLVLQGGQGLLKSSFFAALFGIAFNWFSDGLSADIDNKDELAKMVKHWCLEMAELDGVTGKKETSTLKGFITRQTDEFRPPYGRAIQSHPRRSILAATVNPKAFLKDDTGNRRFWVLQVLHRIDLEAVRAERDQLWAEAVEAYKAGEQWWLTPEEEDMLAASNRSYEAVEDVWTEVIETWLLSNSRRNSSGQQAASVREILEKAFQIETARQGKAEQNRVTAILRKLGFVPPENTSCVGGVRGRFWTHEEPAPQTEPAQPTPPTKPRVRSPMHGDSVLDGVTFQIGDIVGKRSKTGWRGKVLRTDREGHAAVLWDNDSNDSTVPVTDLKLIERPPIPQLTDSDFDTVRGAA
jgi:predicted P-loop ATPase